MEPDPEGGGQEERESKTTSHSSLATSSGSGSNAGDLAADLQRLTVGQSGSRDAGPTPSQASSGHSSRIMSPAPSNASSVRSPIVGIHSRSLVKKLVENGSVCSVHPANSAQNLSRQSTPTLSSPKKGGLIKRTKTPSGGSTSSGDSSGSPPPASTPRHQGNVEAGKGGKASVHFAESVEQTPSPATKMAAYYNSSYGGASRGRRNGGKSTPPAGARDHRDGFDAYMSLEQVQKGLKKGELIEGVLRINPKRSEDAYISAPGVATDILICGRRDQHRALEGDKVVVRLYPRTEWKVLHEKVLDWLPVASEEVFARLYDGVQLSPNVAEMVRNAREGNVLQYNLFSAEDLEESAAAGGMIGGNFADPEAILAVNSAPMTSAPLSTRAPTAAAAAAVQTPRIRVRDFRDADAGDLDSDGSYDIEIEEDIDTDEEAKKAKKNDGMSPDHPPGSIAVPPHELLGDIVFDERSDDAESDGEAVALQHAEDKEFFENLLNPSTTEQSQQSGILVASVERKIDLNIGGVGNEACVIEEVKETVNERVEVCSDITLTFGSGTRASVCDETKDTSVDVDQEGSDEKNSDWEDIDDVTLGDSSPPGWRKSAEGKKKNRRKEKKKKHHFGQQQGMGEIVAAVDSVQRTSFYTGAAVHPSVQSPPPQPQVPEGLDWSEYYGESPLADIQRRNAALAEFERREINRAKTLDRFLNAEFNQFEFDCGLPPERIADLAMRGVRACEGLIQRTGRVVYICESTGPKSALGFLRVPKTFFSDNESPNSGRTHTHLFFQPRDLRFPRMRIPVSQIPRELFAVEKRDQLEETLVLARLYKWTQPDCALGNFVGALGIAGLVDIETEGILHRHNIDAMEIPDYVLDGLPPTVYRADEETRQVTVSFPAEEFNHRKDLTGILTCTVDPETARDLDDAVSFRILKNGAYEVGVHIADVSYYVQEGSPLDLAASQRATSVYLVQSVVPMLPRLLCEDMCSLNPGEPKLTFSVVWVMDKNGKVSDFWTGRSIIESNCKLSYGHAQAMIDAKDPDTLNPADFPKIHGKYTLQDITRVIRQLNAIAKKMRVQRYDDGALSLDVPKIGFKLTDSSQPETYVLQQRGDSNKMIEELMLLANMTIAEVLHVQALFSLLRRHPAPNPLLLDQLVNKMKAMGVEIDATSSGTLNTSLNALKEKDPAAYTVATLLLAKPMQLAKYFIANWETTGAECRHFALSVTYYTHFTSPIRRYADIVVHRMLADVLDLGPPVQDEPEKLKEIAERCNNKKDASKKCSEESAELFFYVYLRQHGPITVNAVVTSINDRSIDVMLHEIGRTGRIYLDKIGMRSCSYMRQRGKASIGLTWNPADEKDNLIRQRIELFTPLRVELRHLPHCPKFSTTLVPPEGAVRNKETRFYAQAEAEFQQITPHIKRQVNSRPRGFRGGRGRY